jgi:hypothetical protein
VDGRKACPHLALVGPVRAPGRGAGWLLLTLLLLPAPPLRLAGRLLLLRLALLLLAALLLLLLLVLLVLRRWAWCVPVVRVRVAAVGQLRDAQLVPQPGVHLALCRGDLLLQAALEVRVERLHELSVVLPRQPAAVLLVHDGDCSLPHELQLARQPGCLAILIPC